MISFPKAEIDYLHETVTRSRATFSGRVLTLGFMGLTLVPLVGWWLVLGWFLASLALFDLVGSRIVRSVARATRPRAWAISTILYLVTAQLLMGAIGMAAAFKNDVWGLAVAYLQMVALMLLATSTARQSASYYYASIGPIGLYVAVLGWYSFRIAPHGGLGAPLNLALGSVFMLLHSDQAARTSRRNEIALESARSRAVAASDAKSAFVAMVSHELRTPISGILAGAGELKRTARDATDRGNSDLITQSARMMSNLLNDLLDLSKIEAGRMTVENVTFDLRACLLETVRFWRPELRRRELALRLEGTRPLPRWVVGDPTRLRQILNNLLSNAAKFTERGGITLRTGCAISGVGSELTIEVIDTGHGIPTENLGRLFAPFEQLSTSTSRTHGGTGLGLHISREFARLMRGDLTAASALGEGSTFRLSVLLQSSDPPDSVESEAHHIQARGLRILIVDDHEVNRRAFSLMLQPICEEIVCAEDGEAALAALLVTKFDLVLMDINMPRMGGLETTMKLRSISGANQHVPVIALTGSGSEQEVSQYASAGMDAVVKKPVEASELFVAIDQVLEQHHSGPTHSPHFQDRHLA